MSRDCHLNLAEVVLSGPRPKRQRDVGDYEAALLTIAKTEPRLAAFVNEKGITIATGSAILTLVCTGANAFEGA